MEADDPRHGRHRGYRVHMRDGETPCPACRRAKIRYDKRLSHDHYRGRRRLISALGSARRVQALQALGWSLKQIAARCECSQQAIHKICAAPTVTRETAARIDAVYRELSMTIPPHSSGATRARQYAQRKGYAPPLAWDDIDSDEKPRGILGSRGGKAA